MPTQKKYERILELIKTNSTISLDVLRKKLPDVSPGTFHQVLNTLSKNNLVKKITLDGRSIAYQRTTEYTVEKGREILKSHSQGQEENLHRQSAPERGDGSFFKPAIFEETRIPIRQDISWCGAAYQILKAVDRPLRPTELAERIVASDLVKSRSRSPVNTVYTCIFQDMKTKRSRSQFMKFGKMLGLAEWADRYINDTFRSGSKTDTLEDYWEQYKSREVSENLVASVRDEIQEIRSFIRSRETGSEPSQEKLCFWVWFCYQFGLFWEGSLVFKKIDTFNVAPPLYQIIKKMGIICENRRE